MNYRIAEELFIVLFGLCFGWMGTQMLKDLLPLGIGNAFRDGLWLFTVRFGVVALTFVLSALSFVIAVRLLDWASDRPDVFLFDFYNILLVVVLGATPWASYHIARIIVKPIERNRLYEWEGMLSNVDIVFLAAYIPVVGLLIAAKPVIRWFIGLFEGA